MKHVGNVIDFLGPARRLQQKLDIHKQLKLLLSDPWERVDDLAPMLAALTCNSTFDEADRLAAVRVAALAHWTDDQRREICAFLSKALEQSYRSRKPIKFLTRWFGRGMFIFLVLWAAGAALRFWDYDYDPTVLNMVLAALSAAAVLTILSSVVTAPLAIWYDNCNYAKLIHAVEALGSLGKADAIIPVANALTHSPLRAVAAQQIPLIVNRLSSDDYGNSPAEAVPALCRAFSTVSVETGMTILRALICIGDSRALYTVEFAANNNASKEIRIAAQQLVPILYQRRDESRANGMLLRASSAIPSTEETLLRAAPNEEDAHPEELLRASGE